MNRKLSKILRKQTYKNGFNRSVSYTEKLGGVVVLVGERREYKKLKKAYMNLKSKGM